MKNKEKKKEEEEKKEVSEELDKSDEVNKYLTRNNELWLIKIQETGFKILGC